MAYPTNEGATPGLGSPGGSTGAKTGAGPSGPSGRQPGMERPSPGYAGAGTLAQSPERRYSFRALVAMGILGFTLGRLLS